MHFQFDPKSTPLRLTQVLIAIPLSLVLYVLSVVFYRLFLHPYAKYSGSFWARISYFPAFYHAWIADTTKHQLRCHEKYGAVVRYTPDNLMFLQVEAQKEIHSAGKNFRKGKAYAPMNTHPGMSNLAFTSSKREHGRRRRIIGQGFTDASMKEATPTIMHHVTTFCDHVLTVSKVDARGENQMWSRPVDMTDPTFWLSQSITTELIFGRSYNLLTDPKMRTAGVALQGGLRRNSLCFQYPFLFHEGIASWRDFGTWFLPDVLHKIGMFVAVGNEYAMERIAVERPVEGTSAERKKPEHRDILSRLINGTDPETGTNFKTEDIMMESNILTLAGGDTVGTALQIIFFNLAHNPNVYRTLAQEVRSAFKTPDDFVLGPTLNKCTYLHAVIYEALRRFGATAFWRDADAGGANIHTDDGDYFIPPGLTVGTSQYALCNSPQYFRRPYRFDPDRWIPGTGYSDAEIATAKAACNQFGLGPRGCVAKNLAMSLMLLTTARVMWGLDFRLAEGEESRPETEPEFELHGSFTLHGTGPVLQFRRRDVSQ